MVYTVPASEYEALWLIAKIALGLLARYPFDSREEMQPRWNALAMQLTALPDEPSIVADDDPQEVKG